MRIGIIGAGLIGSKRAASVQKDDLLVGFFDLDMSRAKDLAIKHGTRDFESVTDLICEVGKDGLVIISTLHNALTENAILSVKSGCHVLVEKPGARNELEFEKLIAAAAEHSRNISVGFNHRFHPSFAELKKIIELGLYGAPQLLRARYGHGGRPGYEKEWRGNKELSGGGELLDQGSHLLDLTQFLFGDFEIEYSSIPTLYWEMPVEDNAFIFGSLAGNGKFMLHASWTEWKNLFSFEVFFKTAKVEVCGLGGSYGPEILITHHMEDGLGPPKSTSVQFPPGDDSWVEELRNVKMAINGELNYSANADSTQKVLRHIRKIYSE